MTWGCLTSPAMVELIAHVARARVYAGDWIADCPRPECCGAEHLYELSHPGDPSSARLAQRREFHCTNCQLTAPIEWPANIADITAVLQLRPVPQTRVWYPAGHDEAVRCHIPHGQTVDELRAENDEHSVPTGLVM